jgi:hypothetical protein
MSRYSFFWLAFMAMFVWHWVPGFFATALSAVSIVCLLTNNRSARLLGSASGGVGIGAVSFDWSLIVNYQPIGTISMLLTLNSHAVLGNA